ncbi:hypothetical protein, partial [Micromonospora sp. NPDC049799]|uniref:hypothetical protein n=1 Tax=Micromonospora sp. NPDC049799 TaxID=3154741 RepID=UPI00340B4D54
GLRAALHGGRERSEGLRWRGLRERLLARHPAVTTRLAGLDDDRGVLALPVGQVLGAGLFTAVALTNAQLLVDVLFDAGLLDRPEAGEVPWVALSIVAVAAVPVAIFLALGVWRDTRARRLAGRPARPAPVGAVFGVGLLAGMFLAPYSALFYRRAPTGPPPVTGLLVCVVGAVLLCWWLSALVGRSVPAGRARTVLLPAATTVGVALLLLVWETTGWLIGQQFSCEFSPSGCGPSAAPRIVLSLFAEPWAFVPLALATVTLLLVALRRHGTAAVGEWWAVAVVGSGLGLVLVLPRLPFADALSLGVWESVHRPLAGVDLALTLQAALLVAVALAALLPREVAGPGAAASALLLLATGLAVWVAGRVDDVVVLRFEEYRYVVGLHLGAAYVVVLLAVLAVLVGRAGLGRRRRHRETDEAVPPAPRAPEPGGQPADGTVVG